MALINVDIDLEEFDDDDLLKEVKSRGYTVNEDNSTSIDEDLEQIFLLRRVGKPYDHLMGPYIYKVLGRLI